MRFFYYSIFDKDAEEYGPLFPAKNDAVAIRGYNQTVASVPDSSSYSLWCLSSFDSESGQFDLYFNKYQVVLPGDSVEVVK